MRRAAAAVAFVALLAAAALAVFAAPWAAPWAAAARLATPAGVTNTGADPSVAAAAAARSAAAAAATAAGGTDTAAAAVTKKAELGRAGWTLLHTTAATLPTPLTPAARAGAVALIRAVAATYPCVECREHFAAFVAAHPVDTTSRDSILQWTCTAHNAVNARQRKAPFPCKDIKALDARWGDCGCDRGGSAAAAAGG